ncbi:hypothetical protein K3495_g7814 [Podosphaera aphanis]|nr:hypothetical protein K3495_g7814 [Podosphaera aphanis]
MVDAMAWGGQAGLATRRNPVILKSSYVGGDRHMSKCCQNSMAIVGTIGNPSLFVTFTANPYWSEITSKLHPGEKQIDRPDLITIVFKLKLDALLMNIKEKAMFSVAIGTVYTVEYQKRGRPNSGVPSSSRCSAHPAADR